MYVKLCFAWQAEHVELITTYHQVPISTVVKSELFVLNDAAAQCYCMYISTITSLLIQICNTISFCQKCLKFTWTLLILTKCPSCWTMSFASKGRPSLSQVRVGGGTPTAEHSNSSGLFTAMVSSSGALELDILGGSRVKKHSDLAQLFKALSYNLNWDIQIVVGLPSTVRLKLFVLLPAWLLATQLYRPASEGATSGSCSRVSCPSSSRLRCNDSGWPSFIQVSVGGGTPRASQVNVTKEPWTTVTGSTGSTWSTPGGTVNHRHPQYEMLRPKILP